MLLCADSWLDPLKSQSRLWLMAGHAVYPATTGGDGIDVELDDFALRIQLRKQLESLFVCRFIAELWGDDRAIDHEVIDIAGGEVRVVLLNLLLRGLSGGDIVWICSFRPSASVAFLRISRCARVTL